MWRKNIYLCNCPNFSSIDKQLVASEGLHPNPLTTNCNIYMKWQEENRNVANKNVSAKGFSYKKNTFLLYISIHSRNMTWREKKLATHKNLFNFLIAFCYVRREAIRHGEWSCVCIENKPSNTTTAQRILERSKGIWRNIGLL